MTTRGPHGDGATLHPDDPIAGALVEAIHEGDVRKLKRLLDDDPSLAKVRLGDDGPTGTSRTLRLASRARRSSGRARDRAGQSALRADEFSGLQGSKAIDERQARLAAR